MGVDPGRPGAEDADSRTWVEYSTGPDREGAGLSMGDSAASVVDLKTPPPLGPNDTSGSGDSCRTRPVPGSSDPGLDPSSDDSDWDQAPPPILRVGEVIFGGFELLQHLGGGGMGDVWLVRNVEMDWKRALKLIKSEVARNDRGWKRFKREAQLMAKLEHPNAVRVYGYHRSQSMGCIEMEFVAGRSLDKILAERPGSPRPLDWIVPILDQLCSVLHEAHSHRDEETGKPKPIIHRDLKPSNLMLVANKPPGHDLKVLDFGIAKMIDEEATQDEHLTGYGDFLGTASYCSPEQFLSAGKDGAEGAIYEVDGRSDLYSLGVILYEFLTGVLPFRGSSYAILAARLNGEPPPMAVANPQAKVPPEVERLVLQCLAKDPADRPRDALEVARKFRAAAAGRHSPWIVRSAGVATAVLVAALLVHATRAVLRKPAQPSPPASDRVENGLPSPSVSGGAGGDRPRAVDPVKPKPPLWVPEGYQAVADSGLVEGRRREPKRLRRTADGVEFQRLREGVYIPVDYEPEDENLSGGWPEALIRSADREKNKEDRTRLLRVPGKTYERGGDDRQGGPALDSEKNPCTKHWVAVGPFYIQETEATNGQVQEYFEQFGKERSTALESWQRAYRLVQEDRPREASRCPAVAVDYRMARKIARFFQGRLPTEAEWELVAKSGISDFRYAWGTQDPTRKTRWARLFEELRIGEGPSSVKKFPMDRTHQGIFDMTGNVREWCLEPYEPYPALLAGGNSRDNPLRDRPWKDWTPPDSTDPNRWFVVKGGSYLTEPDDAVVFLRSRRAPGEENSDLGFRIVIDCPAAPEDR